MLLATFAMYVPEKKYGSTFSWTKPITFIVNLQILSLKKISVLLQPHLSFYMIKKSGIKW
jgi:hypothetical protein